MLSTTLAGVVPESLSGVVSICGYLPEIPGWSLPVEHLDGFPVLLVHDPDAPDIPRRAAATRPSMNSAAAAQPFTCCRSPAHNTTLCQLCRSSETGSSRR